MMMSMRQLAGAARVGKRTPLLSPYSVLSLEDTRTFSVAEKGPATLSVVPVARDRAVKSAYERIARKMNVLFKKRTIRVEDVESEIEDVVQYLEYRLNMTRLRAIRAVALHPMLVSYTQETMDNKLAWLEGMGIEGDNLTRTIQRYPSLIGKTERSMDEAKDWFLDLGIDEERIPYLFMVFPQATSYSTANKNQKVEALRDFGLNHDHIRRILQRFPQILTGNAEHWADKVSVMKSDLGTTDEDIAKLLPLVPELLMLNVDQVKEKIASLDELFGAGTGVPLWLSRPRVIMTNMEEVRRSTRYMTDVVGWPLERVASNITVPMRSVDRFIRPRHEFLVSIGDVAMLENMYWIILSDAKFTDAYPEYAAFLATQVKQ